MQMCMIIEFTHFNSVMMFSTSVEWPTAMSQFTDYLAKSKQGEYGVRESLHMPKPPQHKPEKQLPGKGVSEALYGSLSEADKLVLSRMDFRLVLLS